LSLKSNFTIANERLKHLFPVIRNKLIDGQDFNHEVLKSVNRTG